MRHALVEFDLGHVAPMLIDLALERSDLTLQRARFIQCHLPRVLEPCRKLRHTWREIRKQSGGSMVGGWRIRQEMYIANSLYTKFMKAGEVLRNARKRSGMSQLQVARRSGITQSVISDYERGKREPGADTYAQLLEILGFTLELRVRRRTRTPTLPDSKLARLVCVAMFAEVRIERKQRQQFVTFFDECATAGN